MTTRTSSKAQTTAARPSLAKWNGGMKPGPGRPKGSATAGVVKGAEPRTHPVQPKSPAKVVAAKQSNPFGVKQVAHKSPFPGMKPVKAPKK
jgi:hypothetical protein